MKIEYLRGSKGPLPLVRLFEYTSKEIGLLRQACNDLAGGRTSEYAIYEQPWVVPIGGCRFYWRACAKDIGVRLPKGDEPLVLYYSDEAWREVEENLPNRFNWLTMEGDVDVLISMDGRW